MPNFALEEEVISTQRTKKWRVIFFPILSIVWLVSLKEDFQFVLVFEWWSGGHCGGNVKNLPRLLEYTHYVL